MNYFDTYAHVVTWFAICIMIVFGMLFGWAMHQIDFVKAYPQAPIKTDMYMELALGKETHHGNSKSVYSYSYPILWPETGRKSMEWLHG